MTPTGDAPLRRLDALDWLLLGTLLPLWLGCMALVVWHAHAHPPGSLPFIARADSADALPHVVLVRSAAYDLRVGDQLLSVGGRDLRGAGAIRVGALASAARVADPAARLEILRDGEPLSIAIPTSVSGFFTWWVALSFSASLGFSGVLLLLRARSWHLARRYFIAVMLWSIAMTTGFQFAGGGWTYLAIGLRLGFWGPAAALTVWNMLEWTPSALPLRAWHKAMPCGVLALGLALAVSIVLGYGDLSAALQSAVTAATGVASLYGIYRCYSRADAGEQRQLRWVFLGFGLAFAVLTLSSLSFFVPALAEFSGIIVNTILLSSIAIPIGLVISITGYQYLDIDRLISGTAAAAILAAALAGGAFAVVPPVAHAAGAALGVESGSVQLVLSMVLAALLVPAYQRILPRVERRLFPEREAVGAGFAKLLDELSACRDAGELTRIAGEGVDALLRPESIVTYAREGEAFTPVFARGRALPPAFEASAPLVSALRARSGPLAADRFVHRAATPLSPFDRAALDTLEVAVISPTHRRGDLIAFQCLGPKRSNDVYTATDLALLAAVASKAADLLARFDDATTLQEAREMQAALRRYVPGAVAREIGKGADLSSGEREVSVLFVDIRGYTQLAEPLDADQIFTTLNRHTEEVSTIVGQHGGSVVEFHGDGLMAVFGAPRAIERKEACAVAAAREVVAKLERREFKVGIGVATGSAFVGDIQSADRRIWSVVGNTTNLAARLQAMTRDLGAVIAVDATTRERAGAACAGFLLHRGQRIRGRSEALDLWTLPLDAPAAGRSAAG